MCSTLNPVEIATDASDSQLQKISFKRMATPQTPMSTLSTAPPSPLTNWNLDDDHLDGVMFGDLETGSDHWETTLPAVDEREEASEANVGQPRICMGIPPLSSNLGKWAQWSVEWEKLNGDLRTLSDDETTVASEDDNDNDNADETPWETALDLDNIPRIHEDSKEQPRICIAMPPLSSNLGKACQWEVNFEMYNGVADEPQLSSKLGLWSRQEVEDNDQ